VGITQKCSAGTAMSRYWMRIFNRNAPQVQQAGVVSWTESFSLLPRQFNFSTCPCAFSHRFAHHTQGVIYTSPLHQKSPEDISETPKHDRSVAQSAELMLSNVLISPSTKRVMASRMTSLRKSASALDSSYTF